MRLPWAPFAPTAVQGLSEVVLSLLSSTQNLQTLVVNSLLAVLVGFRPLRFALHLQLCHCFLFFCDLPACLLVLLTPPLSPPPLPLENESTFDNLILERVEENLFIWHLVGWLVKAQHLCSKKERKKELERNRNTESSLGNKEK